ncbi:MAG: hypothetical protein IJ661_10005 [Lachnospiraceae bacterium]|nr:hypothetical protein [Lachnospiraceae bacterium]
MMTNSERLLSAFSEKIFYKELVYSNLKFTPPGKTEVELADLIINLEDIVIIVQLKERNESDRTESIRTEERWLHTNRKNAKKQIAETIKYIREGTTTFVNSRGMKMGIRQDARIVPLVVFDNKSIEDYKHLLSYQIEADEEYVNCISLPDFQIMCKRLVSPMEIIQYIEWRERFYKENGEVNYLITDTKNGFFISKPRNNEALVTQYLYESYGEEKLSDVGDDVVLFNQYLYVLHEHTDFSSEENSSYPIVVFLAHLRLEEIRCFVERVRKGLETSKNKDFSLVGTMRNTIRNYCIVFTATEQGEMIPFEKLIETIYETQSVTELLQVATSWVNSTEYRIDFMYWSKMNIN